MSDYDFENQLVPYSFFQSVIDLLPVAVDIINEEKASVLSNAQFREMFSWQSGYPFSEEIEQVFSTKEAMNTYDYKVVTLTGKNKILHLIIEPLFDHEDVIGAVVIAKDMTKITAFQDEAERLQQVVAQLKAELQQHQTGVSEKNEATNEDKFADIDLFSTADHDIEQMQAAIDYTSRDNATWMALRDLRGNIKKNIPTYLYGEWGVEKRQLVNQFVQRLFKVDVAWIEIEDKQHIDDLLVHMQNYNSFTGIYLKNVQLFDLILEAIHTAQQQLKCKRWIFIGDEFADNCIKDCKREIKSGFVWPVHIRIPSLRERKGDILLLTDKLLPEGVRLSEEVKKKFIQYHWPKNIRQLRGTLRYADTMRSKGQQVLTLEHMPESLLMRNQSQKMMAERSALDILLESMDQSTESMPEIFDQIEKKYIEQVLQDQLYNITHTANKLGIKRQALQYKLKKYNLIHEEQTNDTQ